MARDIQAVQFQNFLVDLDSSENDVLLSYIGQDGVISRSSIGKKIQMNLLDKTNVGVKVSNVKNLFGNSLKIFTPNTLFFESRADVKAEIKSFLSTNPNVSEIAVLDVSGNNVLIGAVPSEITPVSRKLETGEDIERSKSTQVKKLKAYETPTNMFDIMFSLTQKEALKRIIKTDADAVRKELYAAVRSDKTLSATKSEEILGALGRKDSPLVIAECLQGSYNSAIRTKLDVSGDDRFTTIIDDTLSNYGQEFLAEYKIIGEALHPFTKLDEEKKKKIFNIPFIDLQAGSGTGILTSATNTDTPILLQGIELRTKDEIGSEFTFDERYQVATGINFGQYRGDVEAVFENGTYKKAVINTPVYLNPPYTSNNIIAKNSVETLHHGQLVFGLFPTSMEEHLKQNITGHVFIVNKELTGYTEDDAPNNFCFVVGTRHDSEYVENLTEERKEKGLLVFNGTIETARNKTTVVAANSIEAAIKEMSYEINKNRAIFNFGEKVSEIYSYYDGAKERETMLMQALSTRIERTNEILGNIDEIRNLLSAKQNEIRRELSSDNMIRNEKVFPDYRFFSKDGKIKKLTYQETRADMSLLVFYASNYPEILNVIKNIAKESGEFFEMREVTNHSYSLSNPTKPNKKEKVTSKELGLMRLAYFPASFSLTKQEDKEKMLEVISSILEDHGNAGIQTEETLRLVLSKANRMVTKVEDVINNMEVSKQEIYVLVDEDGADICKVNISKTDMNKKLEKLKLFDVGDYVERAKITQEQKSIIFENFIKQMDNISKRISNSSGNDMSIEIRKSLETIFKIKKITPADELENELTKEYVRFMQSNRIDEMFQEFVSLADDSIKNINQLVLKNALFRDIPENERAEIAKKINDRFLSEPIAFFEDKRKESIDMLESFVRSSSMFATKEDINDFVLSVYDGYSDEYVKRRSALSGAFKLSKMLVSSYGLSKVVMASSNGISKAELYDSIFVNTMKNTLGLRAHQHENPESFIGMSDDVKLNMMFWEMRSGKTLGFLQGLYLSSLYRNEDVYLLVESKNLDDICNQALEYMPHLYMDIEINLPKSREKSAFISNELTNTHLKGAEFATLLPIILKPFYAGKGNVAEEEITRYMFEFEDLIKKVKSQGKNIEDIKAEFPDSKFLQVLDICKK